MKVHIQLNDDTAEILLNEGLAGLPHDFAETIRGNAVKRSEIIKLVIQRHLAKLEEPKSFDQNLADVKAERAAEEEA
jgi:hypothetical protein